MQAAVDEAQGQPASVPLRFPLAFDGKLLGRVLRIFTDTVARWYRKRHVARGLPDGEIVGPHIGDRQIAQLVLAGEG